jgi:hypothetical protein
MAARTVRRRGGREVVEVLVVGVIAVLYRG